MGDKNAVDWGTGAHFGVVSSGASPCRSSNVTVGPAEARAPELDALIRASLPDAARAATRAAALAKQSLLETEGPDADAQAAAELAGVGQRWRGAACCAGRRGHGALVHRGGRCAARGALRGTGAGDDG